MYAAPNNLIMRWIAEVGRDLPDELSGRLRAGFYTSVGALIAGALNTIAVACVAFLRSGDWVFAIIASLDLCLLLIRLFLLGRTAAPSSPIFATGLLWACLQGATIIAVVLSNDMAMSIVVLASGLGAVGGILGRNFAAPRYAMAQILVIDLSYKAAFAIHHTEFALLLAVQTVMFVLMIRSVINQQRQTTIMALTAELDSRRRSITDPLTGLLNRRGLEEAYADRLHSNDRTLFYLDLDGFKQVNDRFGHAAGDELLREVSRRLNDIAGELCIAARLGGDEFLLLAEQLGAAEIRCLGARIIEAIAPPYFIANCFVETVGVSVGAARDRLGTFPLEAMMLQADEALYAAKASGKGRFVFDQKTEDCAWAAA